VGETKVALNPAHDATPHLPVSIDGTAQERNAQRAELRRAKQVPPAALRSYTIDFGIGSSIG
jgi:hypothetical protein